MDDIYLDLYLDGKLKDIAAYCVSKGLSYEDTEGLFPEDEIVGLNLVKEQLKLEIELLIYGSGMN